MIKDAATRVPDDAIFLTCLILAGAIAIVFTIFDAYKDDWFVGVFRTKSVYKHYGVPEPDFFMTLKEFKSIYAINTDHYVLHPVAACRREFVKWDEIHETPTFADEEQHRLYKITHTIGFKGLEYRRYRRWYKQMKRNAPGAKLDKAYAEFMRTVVQADVDNLQKRSMEEIDRARVLLMEKVTTETTFPMTKGDTDGKND